MELDNVQFLLQGGAATMAGLLMGLERKFKGKPAGLKTNMLVALGACAFVTISLLFKDAGGTDMTRMVGQYLGLTEKQTFKSWTVMTSLIAITGLVSSLGIWYLI